MKIAVIDYGAGNLKSVTNALKKLGQNFEVINFPGKIDEFDKLIFPGVGAANFAMPRLQQQGWIEIIKNWRKPFLGICLGMQLLADFSEEGGVGCLQIIPGQVKKFTDLKVPQIGWNRVQFLRSSKLFEGIADADFFYFVNSYYFAAAPQFVVGQSKYGINFPAIVEKDNFYAVQFHPEKSDQAGLKLLLNFCEKC